MDKARGNGMFDILEYDDAPEDVREIYDDILKNLGNEGLVDYFKVLGKHNKNILGATWDLLKKVLIKGELPRSLKELVFVAVSNENNCRYCTDVHSAVCKMMHVDENTLQKVLDKAKDLNPKRVKVAIDFAIKMAINVSSITSNDHQILMDVGLSKSEIFELMSLVSVTNYSNTLAQGMMIAVDNNILTILEREST
ncbi:MAG: putative peroxidase-related enzyme [Alteromonadaceae bacterium]|jgi:uncharacterized peroxidase-related enzyme